MKVLKNILKFIGICIVCTTVIGIISIKGYSIYLEKTTTIETPNGISSLEKIQLGGVKQWIFIRGENLNNPVLLFLHGGPGEPSMGMSSSRKLDSELIKYFTVVHWDQRGAGKSYRDDIPVKTMSIDSLVNDCNELIDHLRKRFTKKNVFLVAHSSGTFIGLKAAQKYPGKIAAYVGIAQLINDLDQQRISYNYIVDQTKKSGDINRMEAIKEIGSPPYNTPDKIFQKARHIVHYGGFIHEKPMRNILDLVLYYMTSPEYSFIEGINTAKGKGLDFTMAARFDEIKKINYYKTIPSLNVPVYFFQGTFDMIAPSPIIKKYFRKVRAPKGKKLLFFEKSAHMLIAEENKKYQDLLINVVRKNALEK